jgi:putative permease
MNNPQTARLNRWLVISGFGFFALLMFTVPGVVKMVVLSALLAYIFDPLVTAIELRGLGRTASTCVFFLFVTSACLIMFTLVSPLVMAQLEALRTGVSTEQTAGFILRLQAVVRKNFAFLGLGNVDLAERIQEIGISASGKIIDFIVEEGPTLVVYAVAVPFMIFFLLKDGREIKKALISIVPNKYFEFSLDLAYKMDVQLGNYLRSQFLDAVTFGVLSTITLWILGVKYFLVIGLFAGLANLIPYVGPVAGALPAIAVSLFETGDITKVFQVVLAFVALKLLDDSVIQPTLVAKGVNLHPLLVLLAIIIGGEMFGILGMILAVPATGFVKVVFQESLVTLKKYGFRED